MDSAPQFYFCHTAYEATQVYRLATFPGTSSRNTIPAISPPGDTPTHALVSRIFEAAGGATQTLQTEPDTPAPHRHLINLWRIRDTLQKRYCAGGRTYSDLVRIRQHNALIRRHTSQLARNRWEEHCASFSHRTGARKLWGTFRAITGGTSSQDHSSGCACAHRSHSRGFRTRSCKDFLPAAILYSTPQHLLVGAGRQKRPP
ncbi:hypothetical protein HPB48_023298 [Haemaphysalis longicornis]|uniref:Uncharacterized protein n=1 Tax=Haemaphysalis longicornis TaxID=44386 RepID=A0A9J6H4W7_HAELO|nr:hypothetical protein HPB48_023298 [Haemaphysalis longicornis]